MAARKPVTEADEAHILELHASGMTRNDIARETGRGAATISRIVKAAGLTFERTDTVAATKAKQADNKARRADLESALLEDAEKLRRQLWEPCVAFNFGGKDNTYNSTELDEPIFADKLKIMQAAGTAITSSLKIAALDANNGDDEMRSMLTDLFAAMGQAWREGETQPAPE